MAGFQLFGEALRIGLAALMGNKIRASLTILGVAIGVGVVVTMAALITGIRTSVMTAFESSGTDNLILTPWDFTDVQLVNDGSGRPPWWDRPNITVEEVNRIQELASVREAIHSFDFPTTVSFEGNRITQVQGLARSSGWPAYTGGDFPAGRNYTAAEERQGRAVVVLASDLAEALFGQRDPVGKRIRVSSGRRSGEQFSVVGVFQIEDNIFAESGQQNWFILPWTTADRRLQGLGRFNFRSVLVVPAEGYSQSQVQDDVIGALRAARGLSPADENDFALIESTQLLELFDRLTGVFFLVMLALSSVALMVGGVGVIGIMMISVTERTREIGVRKALGATRREILWQFLAEAGMLTFIGGAVGLLIGWGAAAMITNLVPALPARIPLWSVIASLASAILTGIFFGLLPAVRGSRLDPVDALRYE
jgi:putative ABC transport system permease protein